MNELLKGRKEGRNNENENEGEEGKLIRKHGVGIERAKEKKRKRRGKRREV